jgi:hypothetical protein
MQDMHAQWSRRFGLLRLIACLAGLAGAATVLDAQSGAAGAFDRLKALEGKWAGKTPGGQPLATSFRVTAGGSAVIQLLMEGMDDEMPTLYHLDGDRLMATHYCAAKNQPRMVLAPGASTGGTLRFQFLDVTNLASPEAGHMRAVAFTFLGPDKLRQEWTYRQNGKEFVETFEVERQR